MSNSLCISDETPQEISKGWR